MNSVSWTQEGPCAKRGLEKEKSVLKDYYKRSIADRYDGWRVRNVDAVYNLIPFIMRTRMDSQNLFEENISIEGIKDFIRAHRQDIPELSIMHVIMAAAVRMIAHRPYVNRFVVWNRLYARNEISISLMIKRAQSNVETTVKPRFEPEDTLMDVTRKVSALINENIQDDANNGMDNAAKFFGYIPAFLIRFAVQCLFALDNIGLLPKGLNKVSPFHCSLFLTNVGSLGIGPIYHHLYEFGTCSMFVAMGAKYKVRTISADGTHGEKRYIGLRFVCDERTCDGKYYAGAMKQFRHYMAHPEELLLPPEAVAMDDGVPARKRRAIR